MELMVPTVKAQLFLPRDASSNQAEFILWNYFSMLESLLKKLLSYGFLD